MSSNHPSTEQSPPPSPGLASSSRSTTPSTETPRSSISEESGIKSDTAASTSSEKSCHNIDCLKSNRQQQPCAPPLPRKSSISDSAKTNSSSENTWPTEKKCRMYAESNEIEFRKPNGTVTSYKPDLRVRIRTIGLIGALLPGIGCYICIAYTYLFQLESVKNFTSTNCEDVKSVFPPVSYSIGVWKPQKYFWLFVLTIHFPPRLLFGYVYKSQYRLGESEYRTRNWFPKMINIQVRLMFTEAVGLILLSIIDIESYFVLHAIAYAIWLTAFNFNMLFNCILHYHSGIRNITIMHENIFVIKCAIFIIAYPLSVSTGFSYFSYVMLCSGLAYALFAIAEYVLIGCNCLFYFLLVWELTGSRLEFFITHKNCTTRTQLNVI